ncbi:MAG: FTR1 family protein [Patescibacteria group bacterium]|jgi:high-affinity iron transporter
MIASFIITLRETLEAALIVGIVIGILKRSGQYIYYRMVWYGVLAGIALSILGAALFQRFVGGFSGSAEELFEGITMIVGSILITTLIIWVMRRKDINSNIKDKINNHLYNARPLSIFFMILVAVLREGIETVIFLESASLASGENNLWAALSGIVVAVVLGIAIYFGFLHINIKRFFAITSIILIFFAAGLLAHGVHELQEVGVLPVFIEQIWDINPSVFVDGVYPLWHENGYIGSFLKGLFGYNANPSLLELLSYILYIIVIAYFWKKAGQGKKMNV